MLSFFQNAFQFSLVIALSIVFPRQLVLAQTKDTTRVDTFAIALKRFSIEITNLKAQADTSAQRFDRQLKDLEKNLVSAKDPQRLKILEERIRILEEKNKANDEWKSQLLRRRYEFALQAHDKMIQGVT
ncbi:MAG: hypothetical protein KDC45_15965 [Bacteroidetes bacterium]|nr:hypothetical protein [Bacteroidota bacterium]